MSLDSRGSLDSGAKKSSSNDGNRERNGMWMVVGGLTTAFAVGMTGIISGYGKDAFKDDSSAPTVSSADVFFDDGQENMCRVQPEAEPNDDAAALAIQLEALRLHQQFLLGPQSK